MGELERGQLIQRISRLKTAIALGQPDRVPVAPFFDGVMNRLTGGSYRDNFYDYDRAGQSAIAFLKKYPNVDAASMPQFTSGIANELGGTKMIDWPGRPGTRVSDYSTHQIEEYAFLEPEEYPELLRDYTGFMLRKYIPRAFPKLAGLKGIAFNDAFMMNTSMLTSLGTPDVVGAMKILEEIAGHEAKAMQATFKYSGIAAEMGYPTMISGVCEAPYDIIGDYFRGTIGIFEDILDEDVEPWVEQACDMFADMQIGRLQYLRYLDLPFKVIFFPLHKGMDGFIGDEQYERLYWKPLKKIIMALIDMGDVVPYIYTEGPYNTRLEYLADVPKGKVLYHFEKVDMKKAKEIVGRTSCIMGNLSISNMEFGTPQQIIDQTKELLDTCAPGGGYIFDFDGCLENAKEENIDAMFETLEKYGKY